MSTQCTSWAYRCRVGNATAKAVLLYLADRASDDGTGAWPSVSTICKVTEFRERSVRNALTYLEAHGFILRGDQRHAALAPRGRTRPRQYRSVVWDLAVDTEPERLSAWLDSTHASEHEGDGADKLVNPDGPGTKGHAVPDNSRGALNAGLEDGQGCIKCRSTKTTSKQPSITPSRVPRSAAARQRRNVRLSKERGSSPVSMGRTRNDIIRSEFQKCRRETSECAGRHGPTVQIVPPAVR